jgi:hypothetical protein
VPITYVMATSPRVPTAARTGRGTRGALAAARKRHRRHFWLLAAVVLALGGAGTALTVAVVLAHRDSQQSHAALRLTAREVAGTAQVAIEQEDALLLAEAALF